MLCRLLTVVVVVAALWPQTGGILLPGRLVQPNGPSLLDRVGQWFASLFPADQSDRFQRRGSIDMWQVYKDDDDDDDEPVAVGDEQVDDENADENDDHSGQRTIFEPLKLSVQADRDAFDRVQQLAWPGGSVDGSYEDMPAAEEVALRQLFLAQQRVPQQQDIDVVWVPTTVWELHLLTASGSRRGLQTFDQPDAYARFVRRISRVFPDFMRDMHRDNIDRLDLAYFAPICRHFLAKAVLHYYNYDYHGGDRSVGSTLAYYLRLEMRAVDSFLLDRQNGLAGDGRRSLTLMAIRAELDARRHNKALLFGLADGLSVNEPHVPVVPYMPHSDEPQRFGSSLFHGFHTRRVLGSFFCLASRRYRHTMRIVYVSLVDKLFLTQAGRAFFYVPPLPLTMSMYAGDLQTPGLKISRPRVGDWNCAPKEFLLHACDLKVPSVRDLPPTGFTQVSRAQKIVTDALSRNVYFISPVSGAVQHVQRPE